jgi:uncharacterized delta-60 repeat protein
MLTATPLGHPPPSPAPSVARRGRFGMGSVRVAIATLAALAVLGALLGEVWLVSRPGALDPRFGDRGVVVTPIADTAYGSVHDFGPAVIGQDGSIVAGGSIGWDLAVLRLHPDGRPDASFGPAGLVRTRVDGMGVVSGVALQPDGMLVAVGTVTEFTPGAPTRLVVARYRTDGRLDPGFGRNGLVEVAGWRGAVAVAVDGDGGVVVAGTGLARLTASGAPDPAFGHEGAVEVPGAGLAAVAIAQDGRMVVAGGVLARYMPDGRLDPSFGVAGIADSRAVGNPNTLALQADGRIVVGGDMLARYMPDGSLDPSFGAGGSVGGLGAIHAVGVRSDGVVFAAGTSAERVGRFVLGRYGPDGTPDPSFGTDGIVVTDVGGQDGGIRSLALQPDGMVVAAGYRWSGGCGVFGCGGVSSTLVLVRYTGQ